MGARCVGHEEMMIQAVFECWLEDDLLVVFHCTAKSTVGWVLKTSG